jgi:hypothetical protein
MEGHLRRRDASAFGFLLVAFFALFPGCGLGVNGLSSGSPDGGPDAEGDATKPCATSQDCTSANPCQTGACDASTGTCTFSDVADGTPTPGVTPTKGNCHAQVCKGGVATAQVDDTNVPAAANDCSTPICTNGTPGQSYAMHPSDSPCSSYMGSSPGFCDGKGHCDQCAKASECANGNACKTAACTAGACVLSNLPDGTKTPGVTQPMGTCHSHECEGGVDTLVVDDGNLPAVLTDCQTPHCNAGTPSTTNNPGLTCPTPTSTTGFVCNASGQCGCNMASDCMPSGLNWSCVNKACVCTKNTCAGLGVTCGTVSDGCGGMLDCDQPGPGPGPGQTGLNCGGPVAACPARCAQGVTCKQTSDCQSGLSCADGVCCNSPCSASTGFKCEACTKALTGQPNGVDGKCQPVVAGPSNDPHGDCPVQGASTCGDSGGCNGAGACNLWPSTTACACMGSQVAYCTGVGSCGATAVNCPNDTKCSGGSCPAGCGGSDANCLPGFYCNASNVCTGEHVTGSCSTGDQCTSGICLTNCCAAACSTTDPVCGATSCDAVAGSCVYPSTSVSCTCDAATSTVTYCNGTGTCSASTTGVACPGNLTCQSPTSCYAQCGTNLAANDPHCATGFWCDGSNGCTATLASGAICDRDTMCTSNACSCNTSGCAGTCN